MEIIVQLILLLAIVKYSLKAALTGKWVIIIAYALAGGMIAFAIHPYIIKLPTDIISQTLKDKVEVSNWAIISTVEAIAGIFLSLSLLNDFLKPPKERKQSLFALRVIPGVLFCVSIAYFELLFFKHNTGTGFATTALIYSGILSMAIFLLSLFFKRFIADKAVQLELKMILNIAILLISLVLNSTIADYNTSNASYNLQWQPLLSFVLLVISVCCVGIYLYKSDLKSKITQKRWNK